MQNVMKALKIRVLSLPLLLAGLSLLAACGGVTPGDLPFLEDAEELTWKLELQNESGGNLDLTFSPAAGDAAYRDGGLAVVKDGVSEPVPVGSAFTLPAGAKLAATLLCNAAFTLNSGARMAQPPTPPQPCPAEDDAPKVVILTGPVWRLVFSNPSQLPVQIVTQNVAYPVSPTLVGGTTYDAGTNTIVLAPRAGSTAGSFSALLPCSVEAVTSGSGTDTLENDGAAIQNGTLNIPRPGSDVNACETAGASLEAAVVVVRAYWELELVHAASGAGAAGVRAVLSSAERTLSGGNYVYPPVGVARNEGFSAAASDGSDNVSLAGSDTLEIAAGRKFIARILCGERLTFSGGIEDTTLNATDNGNRGASYPERGSCEDRSGSNAVSVTPPIWTLSLENTGSAPLQAVLREADREFSARAVYYSAPQINDGSSDSPAALTNEDGTPGAETLTLAAGETFTAQLLCAHADFRIGSGIEENSGAQTYAHTGCADLTTQNITAARWNLALVNNTTTGNITLTLANTALRNFGARSVYYENPRLGTDTDGTQNTPQATNPPGGVVTIPDGQRFTAQLLCGVAFEITGGTGDGVEAITIGEAATCGDPGATTYEQPGSWRFVLLNPTQLPVTVATPSLSYVSAPVTAGTGTISSATSITIGPRAGSTNGRFAGVLRCSVRSITLTGALESGASVALNAPESSQVACEAVPGTPDAVGGDATLIPAYWLLTLDHATAAGVADVTALVKNTGSNQAFSGASNDRYVYLPQVGTAYNTTDRSNDVAPDSNGLATSVTIPQGMKFFARILCSSSITMDGGIEEADDAGNANGGEETYAEGGSCADNPQTITPARWTLVLSNTSGVTVSPKSSRDSSSFALTRYYAIPQLTNTSDDGAPANATIASQEFAIANGRKFTAELLCGQGLLLSSGVAVSQRGVDYVQVAPNCGDYASTVDLLPATWQVNLNKTDTGAALTLVANGYYGDPTTGGTGTVARPSGTQNIELGTGVAAASVQVLCTQALFGIADGADGHRLGSETLAATSPLAAERGDEAVCNTANSVVMKTLSAPTNLEREHWQLELTNSAGDALTVKYAANANIYAVAISGSGGNWDSGARTILIPGNTNETATIKVGCVEPPATSSFVINSDSIAQADDPARTTTGQPANCGASNEVPLAGITLSSALLTANTPSAEFDLNANGGSASFQYDATSGERVFITTTGAHSAGNLQLAVTGLTAAGPTGTTHLGLEENPALAFTVAATAAHTITVTNAHATQAESDLELVVAPLPAIGAGVQAITQGQKTSCFLLGGAVSCVGINEFGRLGVSGLVAGDSLSSPSENISLLRPVTGLAGGVTALSVSFINACAIQNDDAYCWGFGSSGQLGTGATPPDDCGNANNCARTPQAVSSINGAGNTVRAISSGNSHACAIIRNSSNADRAMCWGAGTFGQLGNGGTSPSNSPVQVSPATGPVAFDTGVTALSAGGTHNCAIRSGNAYCWGDGDDGRLGLAVADTTDRRAPAVVDTAAIPATDTVRAISAGQAHTCAIIRNSGNADRAMCWGEGGSGRLGNGGNSDSHVPVQVGTGGTALASGVTALNAGFEHTCAIHNNVAKCWGEGGFGRLGLGGGNTSDQTLPVNVAGLPGSFTPARLSTGNDARGSCVISTTGQPYCWGAGGTGILGNGANEAINATPGVIHDSSAFGTAAPQTPPTWTVVLSKPVNVAMTLDTSAFTSVLPAGVDSFDVSGSIDLTTSGTGTTVTLSCADHASFDITGGADGYPLSVGRFAAHCNAGGLSIPLALERPTWRVVLRNDSTSQVTLRPVGTLYAVDGSPQTGDFTVLGNRSAVLSIACTGTTFRLVPITPLGYTVTPNNYSRPTPCGSSTAPVREIVGSPPTTWQVSLSHSTNAVVPVRVNATTAAAIRGVIGATGYLLGDNIIRVPNGGSATVTLDCNVNFVPAGNTAVDDGAARHNYPGCGLAELEPLTPLTWSVQVRLNHSITPQTLTFSPQLLNNALTGGAYTATPTGSNLDRVTINGAASQATFTNNGSDVTFSLLCSVSRFFVTGGVAEPQYREAPTSPCDGMAANAVVLVSSTVPNPVEMDDLPRPLVAGDIRTPGYTAVTSGRLFVYTTGATETMDLEVTSPGSTTVMDTNQRGVNRNAALAIEDSTSGTYTASVLNATGNSNIAAQVTVHWRPALPLITGAETIAMGTGHACFLLEGAVNCAGHNQYGRLGAGSPVVVDDSVVLMRRVSGLGRGVIALSSGREHACAVLQDGSAQCWGRGHKGQLGHNSSPASQLTPVTVQNTDSSGNLSGVRAIAAGTTHTCAIVHSDGDDGVMCWGDAALGRLGNLQISPNRPTPQQVSGFTSGITALSAGANHTCAIRNEDAYCWGWGGDGRLGNGSSFQATTPEEVSNINGGADRVIAISAGGIHGCAIIRNGSDNRAMCWGRGDSGQLGNSSTTAVNTTPQQVTGLMSGVTAISAADEHTCAIHSNVAKCWGEGSNGQLGNGMHSNALDAPADVDLSGFSLFVPASLFIGNADSSCAISAAGQPLCWGLGSNGLLGNGEHNGGGLNVPQNVYDSSGFSP